MAQKKDESLMSKVLWSLLPQVVVGSISALVAFVALQVSVASLSNRVNAMEGSIVTKEILVLKLDPIVQSHLEMKKAIDDINKKLDQYILTKK